MKKIVDELINYLIEKKNSLNFEVEDIIYADLNKILVVEDIIKLEEKRKQIKQCYDMVEYLEKAVKAFMEGE
jgi:hypothetical protein